jgi:nitrate/TMAO reductase-like tetraheme cytochrome c subunit
MRRNVGLRRFLWISSGALSSAFLGVLLVALTNHVVNWSSSAKFCGGACHSMTWANAAYHQSSHYINNVGVRLVAANATFPMTQVMRPRWSM